MRSVLCLLFSLSFILPIFADPMDDRILRIPNPRESGGWVHDGVGYLLDSGALPEINRIISRAEAETDAEIAVVILYSIGNELPKEFANRLFKKWGIGKSGRDNGLLLLHVVDQRRVEIETGYGLEGTIPDILCKRILETNIIPYFKQDLFSQGIIYGVQSLIQAIQKPNSTIDEKLSLDSVLYTFVDLPMLHYTTKLQKEEETLSEEIKPKGMIQRHFLDPAQSIKEYFIFWLALSITLLWFIVGSILTLLPFGTHSIYRFHAYIGRTISWLAGFTAFGTLSYYEMIESETSYSLINFVPLIITLFTINRWIGKKLRTNPRICKVCKGKMTLLNGKSQNKFLTSGELSEEKIKSVDYDIWYCKACDRTEKEKYSGISPAKKCPKCGFETFRNISVRVVRSATYETEGEEIHNDQCAHCKHQELRTVILSKLTKSSSSESYSSSDIYSSSSSSSSSGSSGSWGGGSSGGGGAGSSY